MSLVEPSARSNKIQSGVQSLEIGLSVLDVLIDKNQPMMLKDIAQVMDMNPAKVHRYLVSLIRKQYAQKLEDGRYSLGLRINALGHNSLEQNNILQRLLHAATDIKDALNCGVQIAKWVSEGPVIIQSVEPDSPISLITRIGSRMPLTASATGYLFAAYQPESVVKGLMFAEWQTQSDKMQSAVFSENTPSNRPIHNSDLDKNWERFTQLKAAILTQGYAAVTGDLLMGINAISLPVLLSPSTAKPLEYAITVIGTAEQLPREKHQHIADVISSIATHHSM